MGGGGWVGGGGWTKTKVMLFSTQVEVVVEWMLELSLAKVFRVGQGRLKGDLRVSKRSSKGVKRELRQVQRCFEEVSKKVLVCFKTI